MNSRNYWERYKLMCMRNSSRSVPSGFTLYFHSVTIATVPITACREEPIKTCSKSLGLRYQTKVLHAYRSVITYLKTCLQLSFCSGDQLHVCLVFFGMSSIDNAFICLPPSKWSDKNHLRYDNVFVCHLTSICFATRHTHPLLKWWKKNYVSVWVVKKMLEIDIHRKCAYHNV